MGHKLFLDANIILDFTLKRDSYPIVFQLFDKVVNRQLKAFVSPSIVHIVGYWLTKAYGASKTRELLLLLLNDISVAEMNHDTTVLALNSKITDVEDALQYCAALHHKVDAFISRDQQLKKQATPSLPVFTPEEFLAIYA